MSSPGGDHARQRDPGRPLRHPEQLDQSHEQLPSQHGWVRAEERAGDDRPSRERPLRDRHVGVTRFVICLGSVILMPSRRPCCPTPRCSPTSCRPSGSSSRACPCLPFGRRCVTSRTPAAQSRSSHASSRRSVSSRPRCSSGMVGVRVRVPLDGSRALPARHPRPRGGASAPLHLAVAERRRRPVAARVPDVPGRSPPTGACTSRTTRTRWVPMSPTSPSTPATPSRPTRCGASSPATSLHLGLQEHGRPRPSRACEEPRGVVHRRGAGGAVRHLHRGRAVVGVPGHLGRTVDDALEVQQPAAGDRRARRG